MGKQLSSFIGKLRCEDTLLFVICPLSQSAFLFRVIWAVFQSLGLFLQRHPICYIYQTCGCNNAPIDLKVGYKQGTVCECVCVVCVCVCEGGCCLCAHAPNQLGVEINKCSLLLPLPLSKHHHALDS